MFIAKRDTRAKDCNELKKKKKKQNIDLSNCANVIKKTWMEQDINDSKQKQKISMPKYNKRIK